ncbi:MULTISPECIES: hypothetical protein [unclassified Neptuniibacter]|uniref:hypothetical protein n=1 Tax=unclassified Neptuniibacter TaxID=2630693 RepID=UPI000C399F45|nr:MULTISPECIES: hypothetical protein [unclassified Neptuniibacter]MAY41220.1 hypothetical protein [Oceanospirillaceae bacterium]
MQPSPVKQSSFCSLAHIPIDEPLKKKIKALNGQTNVQSMDRFYLEMLEQLSPATQKQRYLAQLDKAIQALFRINQVIVAVLYCDHTVECFNDEVHLLIDSISEAPLTTSRISFIMHNHYTQRCSVEYFSADNPTFSDFKKGYLYNDADIEAGFTADETTIEELMCDWLQHYQQWMQDYLYFNLAQVTTEQSGQDLNRLKPLLDSRQSFEESNERLSLK